MYPGLFKRDYYLLALYTGKPVGLRALLFNPFTSCLVEEAAVTGLRSADLASLSVLEANPYDVHDV